MKINFLEPFIAPISGGLRRILILSNELSKRGHKVKIFVPSAWVRRPDFMKLDTRVEILPEKEWPSDKADFAIGNCVEQFDYFMKSPAKKVYYLLHLESLYLGKHHEDKYKHREIGYIAVSPWIAREVGAIQKRAGFYKNIPVTLGGVDTETFKPLNVKKEFDVLGFGHPIPWKGTEDFKKAADDLKKKFGIKVETFYGKGLSQSQVNEMYNKAKVFVSSSHFEGWNNTVLEAMAAGTPVVCTDIEGNAIFAKNGSNCLKVKPKDHGAIARAVEEILSSPASLGSKLKQNGLVTAKELNWELVTNRLENYLINYK